MAKNNLGKTCDAMKDVLSDTIDDITTVAKKSSKGLLTTILENGAENFGDLLDACGKKLKQKVKADGKKTKTDSQ